MRHVREVDKNHRVIMAQVENEVGLRAIRATSPAANEAFANGAQGVHGLSSEAQRTLLPNSGKIWEAPLQDLGNLEEVSGKAVKTGRDSFMGWNYARYVGQGGRGGKREYNVPMFCESWLMRRRIKGRCDYPTAPAGSLHDIWRAGAPSFDYVGPGILRHPTLPNWGRANTAPDPQNRYFIPDVRGDIHGARQCVLRHRQHNAVGYSMMGVRRVAADDAFRAGDAPPTAPPMSTNLPLPQAYATLTQLAPLVLAEHQAKGAIAGAWASIRMARIRRSNWAATS